LDLKKVLRGLLSGLRRMAKFLPFSQPLIGREEIEEVIETLKSGWLTTGPKTREFEEAFKRYIGCKYAIALNSCTGGLHLSLAAFSIGRGDRVITTPFTFISTVNVILHLQALPIFVDIDPKTLNIDPERVEECLKKRKAKAIIPVHYAGQPCDMDRILRIAKRYGLIVIEDAAHAVGAEYKGRKIGSIGDVTCFSFYATKNLVTGEGGMATTNNKRVADRIRVYSLHGMSRDAWMRYTEKGSWYYEVVYPGFKYNMMDIQASLGLHQLRRLQQFQKRREEIADSYNKAFQDMEEIETPYVEEKVKHAWHLYVLKLRKEKLCIDRNRFIEELRKENIGASVHFIPVHLHPWYRKNFGFKRGAFPIAEDAYSRVVSLPIYPKMKDRDIERVIRAVKRIVRKYRKP